MTFVQWQFLVFFAIVFAIYWSVGRRAQNLLLAVASAVFYGWVHPWFLGLLYGSAVLDYVMGRLMVERPARRRLWLTLSLAGNLGMLGWFKYADFFVANVAAALDALGLHTSLHTLGIFLPVGISFYTFQTMSYTLDIYRGQLEPRRNFLDYVVFVSFFPQLVAGPVERASNLLPQMERERRWSWDQLLSGIHLAMWGAFKKVCIADTIAPYVDKIFVLHDPSGPLIWAGTLGFTLQILADFSGYTDIARGTARMLGFELMENFRHPYLAANPSDFWRRWHISFSSWIRDYLYIPLGGNRGGQLGVLRSTFGAMTLSGLWHGASWNFVFWGVYHAVLLTGYRLVTPRIPASVRRSGPGRVAAVAIMFGFTVVGWLIFRETHGDRLLAAFTKAPWAASHDQWVATVVMLATTAAFALPLFVALAWETWVTPRLVTWRGRLALETTLWATWAVAMATFVRLSTTDFIYFQF
ncbi:MAG: MBOAT family protein [Alphaproteobacteria bacterium]|nr:MBOAT family protein [Alphaproteobacteria bacterium]